LIEKIKLALEEHKTIRHLIVGGGVSANTYLRDELTNMEDITIHLPKSIYTGDNAAMVGYLCNIKLKRNKIKPADIDIDASPRGDMNAK
jgi:N6-L-threonylcarbamoyladenine synthase